MLETVSIECPASAWTPVGEDINEILIKMRSTGSIKVFAGTDAPASDTNDYVRVNNLDGPVAIGYSETFSVWVMPETPEGEIVEVIRG